MEGQGQGASRAARAARARAVRRKRVLTRAFPIFFAVVLCLLVVPLLLRGVLRVEDGYSGRAGDGDTEEDKAAGGPVDDDDAAANGQEAEPGRREKPSATGPPSVAIVVDDVGFDSSMLQEWLAVDAPLSFAVVPYCEESATLAEALYRAGHEIMLHIPTENAPPNSFSGMGQLSVGMSRETVFSTLDAGLATVPHVTGINNHQGGRGCDDLALMTHMCEWAGQKGFYVVDSSSSANSQVTAAAVSLGLGKRKNQVFIDQQNDPDYLRSALRKLAGLARDNGYAIGICHFHRPYTAVEVGEMIRELRDEGINFSFARDISN